MKPATSEAASPWGWRCECGLLSEHTSLFCWSCGKPASGGTPLHAALAANQVETALLLIESGADVSIADSRGHTPFHIAAEKGLVPVVKALLARGADAHAVDAEDRTPLSRAVTRGHTEVVDLINVRE